MLAPRGARVDGVVHIVGKFSLNDDVLRFKNFGPLYPNGIPLELDGDQVKPKKVSWEAIGNVSMISLRNSL